MPARFSPRFRPIAPTRLVNTETIDLGLGVPHYGPQGSHDANPFMQQQRIPGSPGHGLTG
jgi:hypothetical protein